MFLLGSAYFSALVCLLRGKSMAYVVKSFQRFRNFLVANALETPVSYKSFDISLRYILMFQAVRLQRAFRAQPDYGPVLRTAQVEPPMS